MGCTCRDGNSGRRVRTMEGCTACHSRDACAAGCFTNCPYRSSAPAPYLHKANNDRVVGGCAVPFDSYHFYCRGTGPSIHEGALDTPFLHPPPLHGRPGGALLPYESSAGLLETSNESNFIHNCFNVSRHRRTLATILPRELIQQRGNSLGANGRYLLSRCCAGLCRAGRPNLMAAGRHR